MIGCIIVKPTEACNLRCSYCLRTSETSPMMTEDVLEHLYIRLSDYPFDRIKIIWHGGEPLTAGIDFYNKAMSFQNKYLKGKKVFNSIQTNGSLINKEWGVFFHKNNFSVGISLDGYKSLNHYRRYPNGEEAFFDIIKGIRILHKSNVRIGLLAVMDLRICGHEKDFYYFMKNQTNSFRLNIVVPYGYGKDSVRHFSSEELEKLADTFIKLYNIWKDDCSGDHLVHVFPFAEMARSLVNHQVGTCAFAPNGCSGVISISYDGSVYSCGRFSGEKAFLMGNVMLNSFQDIELSPIATMKWKRNEKIATECADCKYMSICNGGCAQEAYAVTGCYHNKSPYCTVYRKLFEHIEKDVLRLTSHRNEDNTFTQLVPSGGTCPHTSPKVETGRK